MTAARTAPLSVGLPRQEYWQGLRFPSPGDLPGPGMEPVSPVSPALAGGSYTATPPEKPWMVKRDRNLEIQEKAYRKTGKRRVS